MTSSWFGSLFRSAHDRVQSDEKKTDDDYSKRVRQSIKEQRYRVGKAERAREKRQLSEADREREIKEVAQDRKAEERQERRLKVRRERRETLALEDDDDDSLDENLRPSQKQKRKRQKELELAQRQYEEEDEEVMGAEEKSAPIEEMKEEPETDDMNQFKEEDPEAPFWYDTDMASSREKWHSMWATVKFIFYFVFMIGAFLIVTTNYNSRICYQGSLIGTTNNPCLFYNSSDKCVGSEDSSCSTACAVVVGATGCYISNYYSTALASYTCYASDTFFALCTDNTACPSSYISSLHTADIAMGVMIFIACLFELLQAIGLFVFSDYSEDDFAAIAGASLRKMMWAALVKNFGFLTQIIWVFLILVEIYLAYQISHAISACPNVVTTTGQTFTEFTTTSNFAVAIGVLLIAFGVLGSFFRKSPFMALRGELYRPSGDNGRLKRSLDCAVCLSRPSATCRPEQGPRCCPGFTKSLHNFFIVNSCKVCACMVYPFGCVFDWVTAPLLYLGNYLKWLYLNRHFVGP